MLVSEEASFQKVTFETCSASQLGARGLCAMVFENQKGRGLQAIPDTAEEGGFPRVKGRDLLCVTSRHHG